MTQRIKINCLSTLQQRKEKQKARIVHEFKKIKGRYESEGVNPSNEFVCRILSARFGKSTLTLRRYLKAAGEL